MDQDFDRLRTSLRCTSEMSIARLMLELETGGNIRLEDGKPTDAWFGSCVELVRSRLFLPDLQKFGINDIRINRSEKISDRSSTTQQEQGSQPQNLWPGSTLETAMEYLFYAQSTSLEDQLIRSPADSEQLFIAENGFCGFSGLSTTDFGAAIKLSNSIALLDTPRVTATLIAKGQQVQGNGETQASQLNLTQDMKRAMQLIASGDWDLPTGVLLVAKVFPGYTKCVSNADVTLAKASGSAKYQYVLDNDVLRVGSASPELRPTNSPRILHGSDEDTVNLGVASKQVDSFERKYRIRRSHSPQLPENCVYSSTDESIVRLLQMEPLLSASETIPVISTRLQSACTGRIKYLSLLGCELDAIPDLSFLKEHLEVLVLSYNKIQATSNLEKLSKLITLDLSYNHISYLEHLENLRSLETLEVTHNLIRSFDDVKRIGQALGKLALKHLDLRKNGICESKRYRFHVLQYLPKLAQLDQQSVSQEEILTARRLITQLSPSKVWTLHCQKTRCIVPLSSSEAANSQPTDHPESDDEGDTKAEWSSVEELVLNHELLGSIEGLSKAVNLRVASFSDNAIKRIDGLQACTRLEELYLDDNEITQIENLDQLFFLKKLHLGRNRLAMIQHVDSLENLIQLSLEENQISSLRGLGSALKLMELYLANNQIENLKEIQHLKSLPKLTILDLSGNEITRLPDYRLYTVFYLRRVKVLDGVSVSTQDQSNAKQKYSGKLTFELILDKCGSGGGVTPTGSGEPNSVAFLTWTDISGLEALPRLRILNLNRNKIERLMPSSSSSDYIMPDSCDGGGKGILACLHLEQLHLAYNLITDMTTLGLQFLDSLKVNSVVQKKINGNNEYLTTLELSNNRLIDLEEVEKLAALPSLVNLRMINNPLTKKHLYRQHVLYKLNPLKLLDGKDVYSDEKERIEMLFAAAAASATASERGVENRPVYPTQLVLTPSSIPTKGSSSVGIPQPIGLHNEVLTGSLLRKTNSPLFHGQMPTSAPTFPLPEHEVDLSISVGSSNTTTRSLPHNSYRNQNSLGSQSSWQVGAINPASSLPSSSTATVASAFGANLSKSVGASGVEQLYVGSGMRRRISSVHYDQQSGDGKFGDTKLPAEAQNLVDNLFGIFAAGFNMQPSSAESQPQASVLPASSIPSSSNDDSNNAGRNFSGYVVTFGNQKRYSSYPETTIPYLSTKLQQQARRSSERR
ncbi:Leucine-rich repeat domain, L domain-like [Phytophthora cactorum]|nr:Leucine-rich repeat domain, L domain-like [Phytophthora cactorum]